MPDTARADSPDWRFHMIGRQSYLDLATPENIDMLCHIRRIVARSGVYVDLDDKATQVNRIELRFLDGLILNLEAERKAKSMKPIPVLDTKQTPAEPRRQEKAPRDVYRINDVKAKLSISRNTIYRLVKAGELELVKMSPRASGITASSIDAFVARGRLNLGQHHQKS